MNFISPTRLSHRLVVTLSLTALLGFTACFTQPKTTAYEAEAQASLPTVMGESPTDDDDPSKESSPLTPILNLEPTSTMRTGGVRVYVRLLVENGLNEPSTLRFVKASYLREDPPIQASITEISLEWSTPMSNAEAGAPDRFAADEPLIIPPGASGLITVDLDTDAPYVARGPAHRFELLIDVDGTPRTLQTELSDAKRLPMR